MKVFVSNDHDSHYPVGTASVVIAKDKREARKLLDEALVYKGLKPYAEHPYELEELEMKPQVKVLVDGNY